MIRRSAISSLLVALSLAATPAAGAADGIGGRIFTVAGTTWPGDRGSRGLATARMLGDPAGLAALPDGGFLMSDRERVWRVGPGGRMAAVAGTGAFGFAGDGGPATAARLDAPSALALLPDGGFLVSDSYNHRVRRVSTDGVITTVAGNGDGGTSGDGGPATAAGLGIPRSLALLPQGGFLVADEGQNRVRRVDADGTITTVAGDGEWGAQGDGGAAVAAQLAGPAGLLALADGGFLIADSGNDRIRRVGADGVITTLAGVQEPSALSGAADGGVLVGAEGRVWHLRPGTGRTLVAGRSGVSSRGSGDGGPAAAARFGLVEAVAATPGGGVLIATSEAVRRVFRSGAEPLAVAPGPGPRVLTRGYRAPFVVTGAARVTARIFVSRRAGATAGAAVDAHAGRGVVVVAAAAERLRPAVYGVEIVARSGAAAARTFGWAYLGGRLTKAAVRGFTASDPRFVRAGDANEESTATLCRQMSPKRVDCVWVDYWTDEPEPKAGQTAGCSGMSAYLLRPSGQVVVRSYACPTKRSPRIFKPRPRWLPGTALVDLAEAWLSER